MAEKKKTQNGTAAEAANGAAHSLAIAAAGVGTSGEFAALMSALMSDLIEGSVTPAIGNAVCNAGGKLLKVVEMEQRYGKGKKSAGRSGNLALA